MQPGEKDSEIRATPSLKRRTAADQIGEVKGLGKNATRSRPLPEFAGDELYNRPVPDGAPSKGKLARDEKA